MMESIDKFKEWNLKASAKSVTLEKEISKVPVDSTFWKIGSGDWSFGDQVDLTMHFFSQSEKLHQLVFIFPKLNGKFNEYSSHRPDEVYFSYEQALKLRDALSKESVQKFLVKAKKQAEIDAEFK